MKHMKRIILTTGVLAIGASALIPSMGNASSAATDSKGVSLSDRGGIGSFTPATIDPKLAADLSFSAIGKNSKFRFTPAAEKGDKPRAVTVAVRVNPDNTKAVGIRSAAVPAEVSKPGSAPVRITQTAYNLGVAKGWQKFALPSEIKDIKMPDLGAISQRAEPRAAKKPSRFQPNVELDTSAQAGVAPRTMSEGSYTVDLGGSYKVTRNLDVTAGVRISSERDRLAPLTNEQQDSQAVYVGTQFRF